MTNGTQEANVPAKVTEGFSSTALERSAELSSKAVEAAARAEVESAYVMAMKNPRNPDNARAMIGQTCSIPSFAERAKYRKKVGSKFDEQKRAWVDEFAVGPSIRFAEEMLRCWRNVLCQQTTIYDDPLKRIVKVRVVDLESNVNYSKEITLEKQVERRKAQDREVLGRRTNTKGEVVYIVRATEDEIMNKEAAHASKIIRNNGLRLIPQWIIDDAMKIVDETIAKKIKENPQAARQSLLDGFARYGVMPSDIEKYMELPIAQLTPANLMQLREMLTSIEDGQMTWTDYVTRETAADAGTKIAEQSQPETQGQRLVQEMAQNEAESAQGKADGAPAGQTGASGQSNRTSEQDLASMSESAKRGILTQRLAEVNRLPSGEAFVRGLKLPPMGVPADQLDFYIKQVEQGIERLKASKGSKK